MINRPKFYADKPVLNALTLNTEQYIVWDNMNCK